MMFSCMSVKDFNTYDYGKVIQENNDRIVVEFEISETGEKVVNAFTRLEGDCTGYVKLIYISAKEYDSLENNKYERRKWQKTKTK